MIKQHTDLVSYELANKVITMTLKSKVTQTHIVETIRDLMRHFDKGIAGITNDSVGLFNYTINGFKNVCGNLEHHNLPATKLEDIKSLLKL